MQAEAEESVAASIVVEAKAPLPLIEADGALPPRRRRRKPSSAPVEASSSLPRPDECARTVSRGAPDAEVVDARGQGGGARVEGEWDAERAVCVRLAGRSGLLLEVGRLPTLARFETPERVIAAVHACTGREPRKVQYLDAKGRLVRLHSRSPMASLAAAGELRVHV